MTGDAELVNGNGSLKSLAARYLVTQSPIVVALYLILGLIAYGLWAGGPWLMDHLHRMEERHATESKTTREEFRATLKESGDTFKAALSEQRKDLLDRFDTK